MKQLTIALVKKRWYVFVILAILTILMNVVIWNETSRMLRQFPELQALRVKVAEESYYEVRYRENTESDGRIIPHTSESLENIIQILLTHFYQDLNHPSLFTNKKNNLFRDEALKPLSKKELESILGNKYGDRIIDNNAINDLIVVNETGIDLQQLSNELKENGFQMTFTTLKESYQELYDYYVGNFYFAVGVFSSLLLFNILLIYWLISTALKISRQDMRLLRLVGLPMKTLNRHYTLLFCSFIFLGFLIAMTFIHSLGFGVLVADYVYLISLNAFFMLLVWGITYRKIRRSFDA